ATKTIPPYLPQLLGRAYLWAVPWAELTVGICLILGLVTRAIGLIAMLMVISFTMAVTGIHDKSGGPFHTNLIIISLTAAIMLVGPGRISVDGLLSSRRRKP